MVRQTVCCKSLKCFRCYRNAQAKTILWRLAAVIRVHCDFIKATKSHTHTLKHTQQSKSFVLHHSFNAISKKSFSDWVTAKKNVRVFAWMSGIWYWIEKKNEIQNNPLTQICLSVWMEQKKEIKRKREREKERKISVYLTSITSLGKKIQHIITIVKTNKNMEYIETKTKTKTNKK